MQDQESIIEFYKARVNYFYSGAVEAVDFNDIQSVIRKSTNQMIASKTESAIDELVWRNDSISPGKPMAMFVANHFEVSRYSRSSIKRTPIQRKTRLEGHS